MIDIARLRIELEDVDHPVMRRIEVPVAITLADLHAVIQAAMGWQNAHLYEFRVGRSLAWGVPDPHWPEANTRPAKNASLAELALHLKQNKTFEYLYDFGDDWRHAVKLEAIAAADSDTIYPRLVGGHGACPPEDCGGPPGYAHLLEAIADPDHEDHAELSAWLGGKFDPTLVDEAAIRKRLAKLAKRRPRKAKT